MLYHDSRGVSRLLDMSLQAATWRFWRSSPAFAQRFEGQVRDDGKFIRGEGWASGDEGVTWTHDYAITYTKLSGR